MNPKFLYPLAAAGAAIVLAVVYIGSPDPLPAPTPSPDERPRTAEIPAWSQPANAWDNAAADSAQPTTTATTPAPVALRVAQPRTVSATHGPKRRVVTHPNGSVEFEVDDRVKIPAVFALQTADPFLSAGDEASQRAADPAKLAAFVNRVADDFLREIADRPANRPLSVEQWQEAADFADDRYRSRIGADDYNAQVMAVTKMRIKERSR